MTETSRETSIFAQGTPKPYRWYEGLRELKSLRAEWQAIEPSPKTVYSSYEWCLAFAEHLAISGSVRWLRICNREQTIAIVPMHWTRRFGLLRVVSLGTHSHLSLTDFPLNPEADVEQVAARIVDALNDPPERWDVLWWPRVLDSSGACEVVMAGLSRRAFISRAASCNCFDTTAPLDTLRSKFTSKLRQTLGKKQRKLTEEGEWKVVVADASTDNVFTAEQYEHFLALEASGWKGDAGTKTAIRLDHGTRDFYWELAAQRSSNFDTTITILEHCGRPIAGQFAVAVGGRRDVLKIGYDEACGRFSPGQVLLEEVLRRTCVAQKISVLSLVTNMPWHHPWRPDSKVTISVLLFRNRRHEAVYRYFLAAWEVSKLTFGSLRAMGHWVNRFFASARNSGSK
ncbi:MAG TPA: GNAT family N-acetyltransferase [Methylocella sp.]|jgi:CelD/BcsL family acetyltransferase involved in cellulose biosynthesis